MGYGFYLVIRTREFKEFRVFGAPGIRKQRSIGFMTPGMPFNSSLFEVKKHGAGPKATFFINAIE
jgi:hypothetical protein